MDASYNACSQLSLSRDYLIAQMTTMVFGPAFGNCMDAGIKKTYRLDCMNAQFLNAVVDKEAFPTHIIADAKEVSR